MKHLKTFLYLFALLSLQSTINAQSDNRHGYIVLTTGDTLHGRVDHIDERGAGRAFYEKISLTTANGKVQKYKREKLSAFNTDNTTYERFFLSQQSEKIRFINPKYHIDPNEGKQYFLRVVTKGKLSHYELEWFEQGENTLWSMSLLKKEEDQFFMRADQGLLGLKRKVLSSYFSDCTSLIEEMNNNKLNSVWELVDFYNKRCSN